MNRVAGLAFVCMIAWASPSQAQIDTLDIEPAPEVSDFPTSREASPFSVPSAAAPRVRGRAARQAADTEVSEEQPRRWYNVFGIGRRKPNQAPPAPRPEAAKTLPAVEPDAGSDDHRSTEERINAWLAQRTAPEPPSKPHRAFLNRLIYFWKQDPPTPELKLKQQDLPSHIIVGDDPAQRERAWEQLATELPPQPSTPTIEIFLDQQAGRYKEHIFPALGGRRYGTPTGRFRVGFKSRDHYSNKYKAPMPYALFFTDQCAIHQGSLYVYSHGCIHVNEDTAKLLFSEAVAGKTPVVVYR